MDPPPTPPEVHLVTSLTPIHSLSDEHTCILDSRTSHTILKDKQYFQEIYPSNRPVTTITGVNHIEEGHGPAQLSLPNGTTIKIKSAIYAPLATHNLLSFHDIRQNNLHIRSATNHHTDSLQIFNETKNGPIILETLPLYPPGVYA